MSSPENKEPQSFMPKLLGGTRYIILLAVLGVFFGSMTLLLTSTYEMVAAVLNTLFSESPHGMSDLRIVLIEAVDAILVATVLYVIAVGLYQLFVNPNIQLPAWLHTEGLGDLEQRLAGMSITVLAIIFVTVSLESHGETDILGYGLATAAVIAAISLFLYQHSRHHNSSHEEPHDPED